jgi:hypothetical protein
VQQHRVNMLKLSVLESSAHKQKVEAVDQLFYTVKPR